MRKKTQQAKTKADYWIRYETRKVMKSFATRTVHIQVEVVNVKFCGKSNFELLVQNIWIQIGEPSKHFWDSIQGGA